MDSSPGCRSMSKGSSGALPTRTTAPCCRPPIPWSACVDWPPSATRCTPTWRTSGCAPTTTRRTRWWRPWNGCFRGTGNARTPRHESEPHHRRRRRRALPHPRRAGPVRGRHVLLVSDGNVAPLYAARVVEALAAHSPAQVRTSSIEPGEASKTMDAFAALMHDLADFGATRDACVFALGGGVVGDL